MQKPPLILTLAIDEESFQYFNNLRQQHFPVERNFIDAHLTLFHALPNEDTISDVVRSAAQSYPAFMLTVTELMSIGRGVAFKLESKELVQMHKSFQKEWEHLLTPQDKQKLRPHITVQNKVTAQEAKTLLACLKATFNPFTITGTGLQLWEYLGGPWRLLNVFSFKEKND